MSTRPWRFTRPFPVLVALATAAALLTAAGLVHPARIAAVAALIAAILVCEQRARATEAERITWRLAAGYCGGLAVALAVRGALAANDLYHQPWSLIANGVILLAFPLMFRALVAWQRGALLIRDPHETWASLGFVAVGTAGLELWAAEGGPLGHLVWVERLAVELPMVAASVLLCVAITVQLAHGVAHDHRGWLVSGSLAGVLVVLVGPVAGWSVQAWGPAVIAAAAVSLGWAARSDPPPARPAPADHRIVASTGGSLLLVVAVMVILLLVDRTTEPVVVALAVFAAGASCLRVFRNLRDLGDLAEARRQARTDELTGAANRRALLARVEEVTGRGDQVCLAVIDIDDFGTVNDALGQTGGDALLVAVARRIETVLHPTCVLGRLGGDDFAVVASAPEGQPPTDPTELAARLTGALAGPFEVAGLRLHLTASIGLATTVHDDGLLLFTRAETALRESKRTRSGPVHHDPDRHDDTSGTLQLVEQLRAALDRDELVLFLQPQIDARTGGVDGVEALVRWQHPVRGLLGPFVFVPVAEKHGLIGALTEQVLDLAIRQLAAWGAQGVRLRMSVNLSATNLLDEALPERVRARLEHHDVDPGDLILEITENVFVGDSTRVRAVLAELAALGCDLSIDDYGTGWSSLGYLRQLPVRELKLDRSFTVDLVTDPRVASIVRSTVELAHDLALRVVAEGVEDEPTFRRLADLGCDLTQGYWHARPMPADDIVPWLQVRSTTTAGPVAVG